MSEPLKLQTQKPYALDQLAQLQAQIMQSAQGMVVQRARIEKYRQSDLTAARDTYTELERIRAHLVERLTGSQLFLLEWRNTRSPLQQTSSGAGLQASSL